MLWGLLKNPIFRLGEGGEGGEGSEKLIYSGDCLHSGAWGWYPNAHYALIANSKQI